MNFKLVLLIGLICYTRTQSVNVAQCLSKISADDNHVGKYAKADVKVATKANTKVNSGRLLASVAGTNTLTDLVKSFFALGEKSQTAIKDCKPNSSHALKRCEAAHGTGACEIVAPGLANKKCAAGLIRLGHSICTERCPEGFVDRGLDCYKPIGYKTQRYSSQKECNKTHTTCERYSLGYWVPVCKNLFVRQGSDGCIPTCPEGWMDLGRKCIRPTIDVAPQVFAWNPTDN